MEHPVGANEAIFPGLRGDETSLEDEGHRLNDQLIEELDSDLSEVFFVDENRVAILRVKPKSRQPMAQSAFSGKVAIFEAKEARVVGIARIAKLFEELGAIPAVGDSPAEQKKDGDGVEGRLSPGGGPAEGLGQNVAQGTEVDQAKQEIEAVSPVA